MVFHSHLIVISIFLRTEGLKIKYGAKFAPSLCNTVLNLNQVCIENKNSGNHIFMMTNNNSKTKVDLERKSTTTKYTKGQKQVYQCYQLWGSGGSGNGGGRGISRRIQSNIYHSNNNSMVVPNQSFLREYRQLSESIFNMKERYQ